MSICRDYMNMKRSVSVNTGFNYTCVLFMCRIKYIVASQTFTSINQGGVEIFWCDFPRGQHLPSGGVGGASLWEKRCIATELRGKEGARVACKRNSITLNTQYESAYVFFDTRELASREESNGGSAGGDCAERALRVQESAVAQV